MQFAGQRSWNGTTIPANVADRMRTCNGRTYIPAGTTRFDGIQTIPKLSAWDVIAGGRITRLRRAIGLVASGLIAGKESGNC